MVLATPAALAQGGAKGRPRPAAGAVGPATTMTPSPDVRAKQWLNLVDDKNYSDAYKQMGPAAQGKTAATVWAQKLGMTCRSAWRHGQPRYQEHHLPHLSGMRNGQYATVKFDSSFARQRHRPPKRCSLSPIKVRGRLSAIALIDS